MQVDVTFENTGFFVDGAVPIAALSEVLDAWTKLPSVGAHSVFLGQVRADEYADGVVSAIEFSAHESMAERAMRDLVKRVTHAYTVKPVRVFLQHARGVLSIGEIPVIVAVAAGHRAEACGICRDVLEALKNEVPIYGKELFEGGEGHRWKVNT